MPMDNSMNQVEICCGSYQDAIAAYRGGAKRVELNSALSVGGLSPSLIALRRIKRETDLKVICMVRPRAAGFHYDAVEAELMLEEARLFLENGADGIAFGFLSEDGKVDRENTQRMVTLIHSYKKEAVFHRAIDVTPDIDAAMKILVELKVDRVLTSGQRAKAMEGIACIEHLQKTYGKQIEILPGSGMNASNAKEMIETTGVHQIHSSCKDYREDRTTFSEYVSYAYLSQPHEMDYDVVEESLVRKLVQSVNS